ncbi:MAG TPA: hypothetical protein PLO50_05485 [Nitrospira sp.]|nr:hypothetical protein [Nitrospira sp.]
MMTYGAQARPHMKQLWFSLLVGCLMVTTVVMATLQSTSLVGAAECLVNEETVTFEDRLHWETIVSPIHGLPPTLTWNCFCGHVSYMNSVQFGLGKTGIPGISTLTTCPNPDGVKMTRVDRTTLTPIGKANSKRQPLGMATLPYTGMKSVLVRRTPPQEIKRSTYSTPYTPPAIVGPVQEFQSSSLSSEHNLIQAIPVVPPRDTSSVLFGDHLWSLLNQFQGLQQLPNGESHRMNMTTALALHGRDCVSDCP